MKSSVSITLILFLSTLLFHAPVFAVDPNSIKAGPINIVPKITFSRISDSNIYLSNDEFEEEQDSIITLVNPSLSFKAKDRSREYYSNLSMTSGSYSDTRAGEDDYTDTAASIGARLPILTRQVLQLDASTKGLHDNRGSAFTAGQANVVDEPDEYDLNTQSARYFIGDGKSAMAFNIGFTQSEKEYTNNEVTTGARNYESLKIDATYTFRTRAKVETFIQASMEELDYSIDNPVPGLNVVTYDGKQDSIFFGINWKTTAKTSGSVKFGNSDKSFDDNALRDVGGTAVWEAAIKYLATNAATLRLNSSAIISENEGSGTAKQAKTHSLAWNHKWPNRFSSSLSYAFTNDKYIGSQREDDTSSVTANLKYGFRRWLDLSVGYTAVTRDSSSTVFKYDKNVVQFQLVGTL